MFLLQLTSGLVFLRDGSTGKTSIGGTCGAYKTRDTMLTAAHCVPEGHDISVQMFGVAPRPVLRVSRNPDCDIALLHLAPGETDESHLVENVYIPASHGLLEGGDFVSFGYPVEGSPDAAPVGRLFKGHLQRFFGYEPLGGGKDYFAAELSVPAPPGWSGGVISYALAPQGAVAVVTTNVDSYTTIERLEEVERDGVVYREHIRRVVSYGIAAMLGPHQEWLDDETVRGAAT